MFRLFRLPILLMVAFLAGVMFDRAQQRQACDDAGGVTSEDGRLCLGVIGDG